MSNPIPTSGSDLLVDAFAILNAVDVAVVAVNSNMVVTYWNPAARQLLGWTTDQAVARPLAELLHTAVSELAAAGVAMFSDAETWSGLVPVTRRDGRALEIRFRCSPLYDGANRIVGGVAILAETSRNSEGTSFFPSPAPTRIPPPSKMPAEVVPMTVLLAADSLLVGQGLTALLSRVPDITVVGLARDHSELLTMSNDLLPQALIVCVRSPSVVSEKMVAAVRKLRTDFPDLGSVLISDCGNGFALELLRDGASRIAYLLGDQLPTIETLINCVREVVAGQSVLDPSIVDLLVNYRNDVGVDDLTNRETDVLELISQGLSNRAIAEHLNISVKSIEKSVTSIFRSLDVADSSRVDRRVVATLSYQRARTTGLETELRRIRKNQSATHPVPIVATPRRDDLLEAIRGRSALEG